MPAAFTHTEGGWKYRVCRRNELTLKKEEEEKTNAQQERCSHLHARYQLLDTLFRRHVHCSRRVDLPSEVALQTPQRLIGRLLADVGDHHGGALRGQTLAHRPPDPTASTWVGREEREVRAGAERRKQQPETLLSEVSGAQDVSEMKTKVPTKTSGLELVEKTRLQGSQVRSKLPALIKHPHLIV